ncbi:hypothetical protein HanIR_Chr14g0725501 [Helianthus annuus]|nr:hypothetical protein HanIR_Chr14g0725501 [Helianthus annuus]
MVLCGMFTTKRGRGACRRSWAPENRLTWLGFAVMFEGDGCNKEFVCVLHVRKLKKKGIEREQDGVGCKNEKVGFLFFY